MPKDLSWKAVRRGARYCAPACGRGCLYEEFQRQTRAAKTVAETLGPGWTPKVWENLGWHASVVGLDGWLHVYFSLGFAEGFHAFLSSNGPTAGAGKWTAPGKTARAAIRNVVRQAQAYVGPLAALVARPEVARLAR
jgi:hypothetical protein